MINIDLEYWYLLLGILLTVAGMVAYVKGFFSWLWGKIRTGKESPLLDIPKKTVIITPLSYLYSNRWSFGKRASKECIFFYGRFNVTNITKGNVVLTYSYLTKYKTRGSVLVQDTNSDCYGGYSIPSGYTTYLHVNFIVQPRSKVKGKSVVSDVIVYDQFGNQHKIKKVSFANRDLDKKS